MNKRTLENKISLEIFKANQSGLHDVSIKFCDAKIIAKQITSKISKQKNIINSDDLLIMHDNFVKSLKKTKEGD